MKQMDLNAFLRPGKGVRGDAAGRSIASSRSSTRLDRTHPFNTAARRRAAALDRGAATTTASCAGSTRAAARRPRSGPLDKDVDDAREHYYEGSQGAWRVTSWTRPSGPPRRSRTRSRRSESSGRRRGRPRARAVLGATPRPPRGDLCSPLPAIPARPRSPPTFPSRRRRPPTIWSRRPRLQRHRSHRSSVPKARSQPGWPIGSARRAGAVFGPTQAAARLESSKAFAKEVMRRAGVPTAASGTFSDIGTGAQSTSSTHSMPLVVKASGLAAGKGAVVCRHARRGAAHGVRAMLEEGAFGEAGRADRDRGVPRR